MAQVLPRWSMIEPSQSTDSCDRGAEAYHDGVELLFPDLAGFVTVFDAVPDGVTILDASGKLRYANRVAMSYLGLDAASASGVKTGFTEQTYELFQVDGQPLAAKDLPSQRVLAGERPQPLEFLLRRRETGQEQWLVQTSTPICDSPGRVVASINLLRDTTAVRRAEADLRHSEERYRRLVELCPDGIIVHQDGRIIFANTAAARIIGYEAGSDLVGRAVLSFVPEDVRPIVLERMRAMLEHAEDVPLIEERFLRADGSEVEVEVAGIPFRYGERAAVQLVVRDATLRKNAQREQQRALEQARASEAALEREKEWLAVTLRSIGDGIIATDTADRVTLLNPVAETMTGWPQPEAAGRPVGEVFRILHRNTREPLADVTGRTPDANGAEHAMLVARDGGERPIALSRTHIRDHAGERLGTVWIFRDVLDQERVEQELLRASKLESLAVLAGGIAHDFNNLLTPILANLSLAAAEIDPKHPMHQCLVDAEKAALRSRDLTAQLLTFSKGGSPIRKPMSLDGVVRESASFVLAGSSSRVEIDIAPELLPVDADAGQLSQVVQNLVLNAAQAMPAGGTVQVLADNVEFAQDEGPLGPGAFVRIRVRDHGAGIPADVLPRIFDPFFTTKTQGSGLGLAMVYAVVRKHDGHVSAESELGQGTTFTVLLPVCTVTPELHPVQTADTLGGHGRVLVMDDEPMLRATARTVLQTLGYEVQLARDGDEAIALYRAAWQAGQPFDVVVLDLTVPGGMGGREAMQRLREFDPLVTAVVSSGYADDPVMSRYREHGFAGVVAKPYTARDLDAVLRVAFRMRLANSRP